MGHGLRPEALAARVVGEELGDRAGHRGRVPVHQQAGLAMDDRLAHARLVDADRGNAAGGRL
ncbi:hypothetical protein D3C72_2183760 [compost metagenome]